MAIDQIPNDPDFEDIRNSIDNAYLHSYFRHKKDFEKTISIATRLMKEGNTTEEVAIALAESQARLVGPTKDALDLYEKAYIKFGNKPNFLNSYVNFLLVIGDFQKALTVALKQQKLEPSNPRAGFNVGRAYLAVGDTPSAIEWLESATSRTGDHDSAFFTNATTNLASAYGKNGQARKAITTLTSQQLKKTSDFHDRLLVTLHVSVNETHEAREYFQRIMMPKLNDENLDRMAVTSLILYSDPQMATPQFFRKKIDSEEKWDSIVERARRIRESLLQKPGYLDSETSSDAYSSSGRLFRRGGVAVDRWTRRGVDSTRRPRPQN